MLFGKYPVTGQRDQINLSNLSNIIWCLVIIQSEITGYKILPRRELVNHTPVNMMVFILTHLTTCGGLIPALYLKLYNLSLSTSSFSWTNEISAFLKLDTNLPLKLTNYGTFPDLDGRRAATNVTPSYLARNAN